MLRAIIDARALLATLAAAAVGVYGLQAFPIQRDNPFLVIIEANPGLKQTELAIAAHLDRSSIVPVVDKLEARGYVSRRASAIDRRVNGLWLTPDGSTELRKLKRTVLAHERRIARRLTDAERQQLFDLLAKLLP